MKRLNRFKLLLASTLMLFTSCSDDFLFDFLLGPQPNFIDGGEFAPGLSILGVIRPDSLNAESLSYVLVDKLIAAVNSEPDSFNVIDAKVMVYHIIENTIMDSCEFLFDTTQLFPSIYRPLNFSPQAGHTYSIRCSRNGFPDVTAETTIPQVPVIENDVVIIAGGRVQFSILSHPSASMYDVCLFSGNQQTVTRVLQATSGNTMIDLKVNGNLQPDTFIVVYAYDANLTSYLTAPNILIKPNTYRPPFTTVEGGYGCFGSMNRLVKTL